MAIGITIGGGIYRTPAVIATRVPDASVMLLVWVIGGLIVLCGALTIAELAAALPHTGGMYVYLREGWGRPVAFLYGWAQLVLIRAAALGGISSVFGEYALRVAGIDPVEHADWADYLAAGAILFAGTVNIVGVNLGALFASLSTVAKYGALVVLVAASLLLGGGAGATWSHLQASTGPVEAGMFGLALISVLWAYDGFADVSFASGEVKDPAPQPAASHPRGARWRSSPSTCRPTWPTLRERVGADAASRLVAADTMGALFGQAGAARSR